MAGTRRGPGRAIRAFKRSKAAKTSSGPSVPEFAARRGTKTGSGGPPPSPPAAQARKRAAPVNPLASRTSAPRPPVVNDSKLGSGGSAPGGVTPPRPRAVVNDSGMKSPPSVPLAKRGSGGGTIPKPKTGSGGPGSPSLGKASAPGQLKKVAGVRSAKAYTPSRRR